MKGTPPPVPAYALRSWAQLVRLLRKRFELIARRGVVTGLKTALADALLSIGTGGPSVFQLRAIADDLAQKLGLQVADIQQKARDAAAKSFQLELSFMEQLTGEGTAPIPLQEISRIAGDVAGDRSLLDRHHLRLNTVKTNYGEGLVRDMEQRLAVGLARGDDPHELTQGLRSTVGESFWRAERIARTESAHAFSSTHLEAAKRFNDLAGDVLIRWTEFVDDDSGEPLDDRVSDDSLKMHGQLRIPGQQFWDPVHERAVEAPPNRPNDRATLVEWRASWGEPPGGLDRLDAASRAAFATADANLKDA